MKTIFYLLIFLSGVAIFSGCRKDDPPGPKPESTSLQQLSQDDNHTESFTDEAMNDANILMSLQGFKTTAEWPCNTTIDTSVVAGDTVVYTFTYHGPNCPGTLIRNGKMEVRKKIGTHWFMAGATVIVRFIDLKFTRVSNGLYIIMNGKKTLKNVSGGHIFLLGNGFTSVVYRTSGSTRITFSDNTTRTWHVARQQVFTGTPGALEVAVDGFGNAGGHQNVVTWGTDRNNVPFFISIAQSLVIRETCQWRLCSGVKEIDFPSQNMGATLTFGFNANNQPVAGNECPVKFRIDWFKNGQSGTIWLWL